MKGIILAGGAGTRLNPLTVSISKQMLPIYNKPMIYYPLSTLISSGIKEILIISTPNDINFYKNLLKDSKDLGLDITFAIQDNPNGLAEAFIIGENFINNDPVCLILGDNIFYGPNLYDKIKDSIKLTLNNKCANIFGYYVNDPERFGVAEVDSSNNVLSIEEKPISPKSNYAVVGLYCYPGDVAEKAKKVKPSDRGELEISTLNDIYLKEKNLKINLLKNDEIWFDTGTFESMLDASVQIRSLEKSNEVLIGSIENASLNSNFISVNQLSNYLKNKNLNNLYYQKLFDSIK